MRMHQLMMNPTKSFWGWPVGSSLDLLLHPKGSILTLRKSMPFKRETSKNSEYYKDDWLTSRVYIKSLIMLSTLHQADEEESVICLGCCLPRSVQRNQTIPYTSTCPCNSSIRKTIPKICQSYRSFLGSFTNPE